MKKNENKKSHFFIISIIALGIGVFFIIPMYSDFNKILTLKKRGTITDAIILAKESEFAMNNRNPDHSYYFKIKFFNKDKNEWIEKRVGTFLKVYKKYQKQAKIKIIYTNTPDYLEVYEVFDTFDFQVMPFIIGAPFAIIFCGISLLFLYLGIIFDPKKLKVTSQPEKQ